MKLKKHFMILSKIKKIFYLCNENNKPFSSFFILKDKILQATNIEEFEKEYSAKLWGYESIDEYYRNLSCLS